MSKIIAFYYSQTGQGLEILNSVIRPLIDAGHDIIIEEIRPVKPFMFPWTSDAFFDAFPESRLGIDSPIITPVLHDDADTVIIVYPVWFLSLAIPVHSFFQDEKVRKYLHGKRVITICGCRNMWMMAQIKLRDIIASAGGKWIGSIVLQDRNPNLVSVITIVRWLIGGKKEGTRLFPAAGVSLTDIHNASVFGNIIAEAIADKSYAGLQDSLMKSGAIKYKPAIAFVEKTGYRIFGIWARIILKSAHRKSLLKLFKYYLFAVLFVVSPIGLLFFYLTYPFSTGRIRKEREFQCRKLEM
jgi:hypothetical protein